MIKMIVGGGMLLEEMEFVLLCFLGLIGCQEQFNLLQVDEVDKIEVLLASDEDVSRTEVITITEPDELRGMMRIFAVES